MALALVSLGCNIKQLSQTTSQANTCMGTYKSPHIITFTQELHNITWLMRCV